MKFGFQILFVFFSIGIVLADPETIDSEKPMLRGVTHLHPPFVEKNQQTNRYVGFSVDLLDAIAERVGFDYTLYDIPTGQSLLDLTNHQMTGLVGEVNASKADFAIGEITHLRIFRQFVDLTKPVLSYQHLAAIVSRSTALKYDLCSVEDLVRSSNLIEIGSLDGYEYLHNLVTSSQPLVNRLYRTVTSNMNLYRNTTHALECVKTQDCAILTKSTLAEYLAEHAQNCELIVLHDRKSFTTRHIEIPLQMGSPYLEAFNQAIQQLHADGTIKQLRKQYWGSSDSDKCKQICPF